MLAFLEVNGWRVEASDPELADWILSCRARRCLMPRVVADANVLVSAALACFSAGALGADSRRGA